jgi:hypothetical protein
LWWSMGGRLDLVSLMGLPTTRYNSMDRYWNKKSWMLCSTLRLDEVL